jgi:hypothetical protein
LLWAGWRKHAPGILDAPTPAHYRRL